MAKFYEFQSKSLLKKEGISIPEGHLARTPEEARRIAATIARPVAIKAQAWVTGRTQSGGIGFADTPDQAYTESARILGMQLKGFTVEQVLVEARLNIEQEYFLGLVIDDVNQAPMVVFSSMGGTGIEAIAAEHPDEVVRYTVDIAAGIQTHQVQNLLNNLGIRGQLQHRLCDVIVKFYGVCKQYEMRSAEINPLVLTATGEIVAADCHAVVDDYAVFRHPELNIEVAREFDRPPTELEKIAYQVEAGDHRGTFYFFQMAPQPVPGETYVGFHGAGGGGSMMSMDALLSQGFAIANYCDTSGNPSASKVYRAAKIILSQENISAYFASGSGVASQEQFHSARGLVKAFCEANLSLPAVIRIGGNAEAEAIEILTTFTRHLPGEVEAYGRDTSALYCAQRLKAIVSNWDIRQPAQIQFEIKKAPTDAYRFDTLTGCISIDHRRCSDCIEKPCAESCAARILKFEAGKPMLSISQKEAKKGRCTECLACELACKFHGNQAIFIDLPIPGFEHRLIGTGIDVHFD
jgi:succinyl-CoA synthetase beta subunit